MKKTLIRQAASCLDRIKTALLPDAEGVKKFVLEKTKLNTLPFSLKDHEYQQFILEICSNPDIDLVIQKSSQLGISEVVYRILLSFMARIPGFSCAIVFPTIAMSVEVSKTRISRIIEESEELSMMLSKDVDSSTVKMFTNGSVLYCLGASTSSKSTVINRPLRAIICDEVARCDMSIVTALKSRQRHQKHKSSIYFSTPISENFDISLEIDKCGVIWEQLLSCSECAHKFYPDFFANVRLPGFDDQIKMLKSKDIDESDDLDLSKAYLECPNCKKPTTYHHHQMEWVNTCKFPNRPKIGIKLGAFALPNYVSVADMVRDYLGYDDKNEFTNQCLGLPVSKANTSVDVSQMQFVDEEAGDMNVWGLDIGNMTTLTIGSIKDGNILIHTVALIPIKDIDVELPKYISDYRCVAGVIDYGPNTTLSVRLSNTYPNSWCAIYTVPATPQLELIKVKVVDDEALGVVRQVAINKNPFFDDHITKVMEGKVKFKNGDNNALIRDHYSALRRVRDPRSIETRYIWQKLYGSKTQDHLAHSCVYLCTAARLIEKGSAMSLPLSSLVQGFRLKSDL